MKKMGIWLVLAAMMVGMLSAAAAERKEIVPDMELELSEEITAGIEKTHPFEEGIAPLTGLPASGEKYTPIALILDNSPEVYPHWGVAQADWLIQVPLRRDGGTRMMAIYGNEYPAQAGGARSTRMTNLPVAVMFHAALAYAGHAPVQEDNVRVEKWIDEWDYNKRIRYYDLLTKKYSERVDFLQKPQNLSAHVDGMHADLIKRDLKFDNRGFLFTDEPLTRGDDALQIDLKYFSILDADDIKEGKTPVENGNAACSFEYKDGQYLRTSKTGLYTDRDTGEAVTFSNVIIMRTKVEWEGNYPYYFNHLKTCGQAEIYQNGKHITGAWYRAGRLTRLVLLDENGQEISLQRGRTYMAIADENLVVSYE